MAAAAASRETDRGYRERLRTLSDGLAATQLQLTTLKANRDKDRGEAAKARLVRSAFLRTMSLVPPSTLLAPPSGSQCTSRVKSPPLSAAATQTYISPAGPRGPTRA